MRIASIPSLFVLSLLLSPLAVSAATTDLSADAVTASSNQTYQAENTLGAPDGAYATFTEADAYVTLDMGEGEEGTGDLTLTDQLLDYGAIYRVEFLDADSLVLQTSSDYVPLSVTAFTVDYTEDVPYRYVRVTSTEDEIWKLDAVTAASVVEPTETEEPPADTGSDTGSDTGGDVTEEPVADMAQGLLVKLVDDGDPNTTVDSAVYLIGGDGMRHAFPSETVFSTWFADYETLAYIDPTNLASYQLGGNVTVRPGTKLVKLATDPKVYAVEPGNMLRWVSAETIASTLYGSEWASRVIDVPDTFFGNYTVGDPITTLQYPDGTIASLPDGRVVYLAGSFFYTIPGDLYTQMRFQSGNLVMVSEEIAATYVNGGDLNDDPSIEFPY